MINLSFNFTYIDFYLAWLYYQIILSLLFVLLWFLFILDIVTKYRAKVEKLDAKVKEILDEEYQEKLLLKAEAQANRAEKTLKSSLAKKGKKSNKSVEEKPEKREWFQTDRQRKDEKSKCNSFWNILIFLQ